MQEKFANLPKGKKLMEIQRVITELPEKIIDLHDTELNDQPANLIELQALSTTLHALLVVAEKLY